MEIEVTEQKPLTMVEVRERLESIKKKEKELNFRATKVQEYITEFTNTKKKEAEDFIKKLEELNIPRLRDKHIIKIIDLMPESLDALKAIMAGENTTLKAEDLTKILEVIKKA